MENSSRSLKPHFSPAVDTKDFVFLSGQLAFDDDDVIRGGVAAQTTRCLSNLDSLLAARRLSRRDVVKTTVWLRRVADFQAFNDAYALFFGEHRPARSTLICTLARPGARVEIEAIAVKRRAAGRRPRRVEGQSDRTAVTSNSRKKRGTRR